RLAPDLEAVLRAEHLGRALVHHADAIGDGIDAADLLVGQGGVDVEDGRAEPGEMSRHGLLDDADRSLELGAVAHRGKADGEIDRIDALGGHAHHGRGGLAPVHRRLTWSAWRGAPDSRPDAA